MTDNKKPPSRSPIKLRRRTLLGAGASALAFPTIWIPNQAFAQDSGARGEVKHLIYIRMNGGYRFTASFNGDVGDQFNPFGLARGLPQGTEWGPSRLLESAPYLDAATRALGMKSVVDISNQMALLATVDHEPFSGSADGNHGTGLERYLTGTVGGENSLFTMLNYGIRDQITAAANEGKIKLPPFVLGSSGMSKGFGAYAAYRPPLVQGDSFDDFAFAGQTDLPAWATRMITDSDQNYKARLMMPAQSNVDAYVGTRESVEEFSEIFASDTLKIGNDSDVAIDGISNRELATMFGDDGAARRVRLGLRLFHHGCPAVYLDEGGYDMHSDEDMRLPDAHVNLNRILSATEAALKRMGHDEEGYNYWDSTLVVLGSEFGRTTRGGKFNSAGGSDHGGDFATRWLSMPVMGGLVTRAGIGGRRFGVTRRSDLQDDGQRFSYRALWKTIMDTMGADHADFFTADPPIEGLFNGTL